MFTTDWTVPAVAIRGPVLQAAQQHVEVASAYGYADRASRGIMIIVLPARSDNGGDGDTHPTPPQAQF